ncbi:MAG: TerB family tellurite resistance protein [Thiohalobacteraceae bacterium]|nr:TerB family tellurite resistance protein [Gammaproteobacteria bacterium]
MLKALQGFIDEFLSPGTQPSAESQEHRLHLATAVLLMEMVNADFEARPEEREYVLDLLRAEFRLTATEAQRLADLGAQEMRASVSLFEYTRVIDTLLDPGEKLRVVEMLWRVAYIDGALDKYEEYLVRRIADLLHLSHRQLMQAKQRVLDVQGA